jgi:hypothetical protein
MDHRNPHWEQSLDRAWERCQANILIFLKSPDDKASPTARSSRVDQGMVWDKIVLDHCCNMQIASIRTGDDVRQKDGERMRFKFKQGAKAEIGTEDPWYALTDGGYLRPEDVLSDQSQIEELTRAVKLVKQFIDQCYETGIIEEA